ncbi:CPBP family intramembrane glutamic endopeptidase [Natrialbaceae archaeon A-arb3/5]
MGSPQPSTPDPQPTRSKLIAIGGSLGYIAGAYAFIFAVSLVLMIGIMAAILIGNPDVLADDPDAIEGVLDGGIGVLFVGLESLLLGLAGAILAALSFSQNWIPKRVVGLTVPTGRELLIGAGTVVALLAVGTVISIASGLLGVPASEHTLFTDDVAPIYYVALMVISILLIGPAEELLFRGLIQNYVRPAFGSTGAIVWTSVVFAAIHLPVYLTAALASATVSLVVVFALSLILGAVYERYRNLVLVMLIHGVYNAVLFGFEIIA